MQMISLKLRALLDSKRLDHLPKALINEGDGPLHDDEVVLVCAHKRVSDHVRVQEVVFRDFPSPVGRDSSVYLR